MEALGPYLRQLRTAKGWSLPEARDAVRDRYGNIVSTETLSLWERGGSLGMSAEKLVRVATVYDADYYEVFRRLLSDPDDDPEADPASRLAPDPDRGNRGGVGDQPNRPGRRRGTVSKRRSG